MPLNNRPQRIIGPKTRDANETRNLQASYDSHASGAILPGNASSLPEKH